MQLSVFRNIPYLLSSTPFVFGWIASSLHVPFFGILVVPIEVFAELGLIMWIGIRVDHVDRD